MKNKKFKNYIAFTLTEMTLVLLITSILAAVLTPAITKSISNNAKKMSADVVVSPWKDITTDYPYRGMFNLGAFNYSTVSMGFKPTQSADTYRAPALIVRSRYGSNKTNFYTSPQISIFPRTSSSMNLYPMNIALDNNSNVGILNDSFKNVNNAISYYGNVSSIFIGNSINSGNNASSYSNSSIYIGQDISQPYGSLNSIYIGSKLSKARYDSNTINIGYNIHEINSGYALRDSILIGNGAGSYAGGQFDIKIGHYSGYNLQNTSGNVFIGSRAGYLEPYDSTNKSGYANESVFVGYGAGSTYKNTSFKSQYDVSIGYLAGYTKGDNVYSSGNVNIGAYSGYNPHYNATTGNNMKLYCNTNVGYYAGYRLSGWSGFFSDTQNSVYVGRYAGYASFYASYSVAVGSYAGAGSYSNINSVFIGANTEKPMVLISGGGLLTGSLSNNAVIIGYSNTPRGGNTGIGFDRKGSILIGASSSTEDGVKINNSVGIGYDACRKVNGANKICIGNSITSTYSTTGWNPNDSSSQTFIGSMAGNMTSNYITLYAGHIFAPASAPTAVSDRRLKENIVPSKHSLDDIRKVNIYNYNMKGDKNKTPHIGVIAQEHKKIFPHAVSKYPKSKYYTVSAEWMNFTAVNAVKEIDKTVQQIQASVKAFIKDFMGLKSRVEKLEAKLAKLQKENKEIKTHLDKVNAKLK